MSSRRFPRQPITEQTPTLGDFIVVEYVMSREPWDCGWSSGTLTLRTQGKPYGNPHDFIGRTCRLVLS